MYGRAELTEAYAEKIEQKEIHQRLSVITPGDLNIFLYNFMYLIFFYNGQVLIFIIKKSWNKVVYKQLSLGMMIHPLTAVIVIASWCGVFLSESISCVL